MNLHSIWSKNWKQHRKVCPESEVYYYFYYYFFYSQKELGFAKSHLHFFLKKAINRLFRKGK